MVLLNALGINSTVFIQLGIFLCLFFIVYGLIALPYFNAHVERHARTVGNQEAAARIIAEIQELKHEYEMAAQKINHDFRAVFDSARAEAVRESEALQNSARLEAKQILDQSRQQIASQIAAAKSDLNKGVGTVSQAMVNKLLN